jgi:uncharacterized surface protein with fasciclin (FAS1) repeats
MGDIMSNLVELATADGRFNTLVSALQAANLADTLSGLGGPFTLFAPTDEAFAGLADGALDKLMTDIPALTSVLTYHVVSGSHDAADVLSHPHIRTIQGADLNITTVGHKHYVNDAQLVQTDIAADNGVLHAIDAVLLPPSSTAT